MFNELYEELNSICDNAVLSEDHTAPSYNGTSLTPGLLNAVKRIQTSMTSGIIPNYAVKKICDNCASFILKYAGRYPSNCPYCGNELAFNKGKDIVVPSVSSASDLDPINSQTYDDVDGQEMRDYLSNT
jgi:hypothetical protein